MKANKLILAVLAALLLASCNDDSNDDKIRINGFANDNATIMVDITDGTYQLYWESPIFSTNRNDAIGSPMVKYDVYVKQAGSYLAETKIATVEGSWLNIAVDKVSDALNGAQGFEFVVRMADESLSNLVVYNSETLNINNAGNTSGDYLITVTAVGDGEVTGGGSFEYGQTAILTATPNNGYFFASWSDGSIENPYYYFVNEDDNMWAVFRKQDYKLESNFQGLNTWFLAGDNKPSGKVENGNYIINIVGEVERDDNGNATVWNDNFEIVFNGLPLQSIGNEFKIEFDIMWVGDKEGAVFRICSGADNYIEEISKMDETFVPLSQENEEVWNPEYNTELIFADFNEEMGKTFTVGNEVEHIQWGGTIGKRGEKYIGIEINLAGKEENSTITSNGPGRFIISNMQILINGKHVW